MGMTDKQFTSYRREQLYELKKLLADAIETKASEKVIKGLEAMVEKAKADTEA
jgi:hypothetical protein